MDASSLPRVSGIMADQAASFAILRRPAQADDPIPTDATGPMGANLRLARKVTSNGLTTWVVPASGHLCLRSTDDGYPVWTCVPNSAAADGDLVMTLRNPATDAVVALFALVPDGVLAVTLQDHNGPAVRVQVKDNVVLAPTPKATTFAYSRPDGTTITEPLP